jgi:hypothetical protein
VIMPVGAGAQQEMRCGYAHGNFRKA